ncbi:Asp23/Gls24 family envelope stress response protein [Microbispora bryophytorum]|uniref:Stress protein n=1 Tax=Microbispora bryophytorum TaxID=1460882 RepID=A0A8H9H4D5_9ACTN|nr:Asp23/Gls24 family envelope stress response protein [Microbispora bryophytorum]TQS02508.1 Asp23/Gls24 family envelope stress response protein [Microbispora bryophytorum]GGO27897.1 stress protein [Microbispora bryophytorum]
MTETRTSTATVEPARGRPLGTQGGSGLMTERGRTTIADEVVAKIAGMAAREIDGVHDFGTGTARAFGAIKGALGGEDGVTRGMSVEVGERQAAVDIHLIVEYGVAIPDLAQAVRSHVIRAVERMCGLEVTEVNIAVDDVHLPRQQEPQAPEDGEPRVQ